MYEEGDTVTTRKNTKEEAHSEIQMCVLRVAAEGIILAAAIAVS